MQALGLIETKGLLVAVEAADTMVKSADVSIIDKTYVGGGLVTITISGDVAAVKASIEAGVAAVKKLNENLLVSDHVIPSPHDELESIIGSNLNLQVTEDSLCSEYTENTNNEKIIKETIDNKQCLEHILKMDKNIEEKNQDEIDEEESIKEIEDIYVELDKLDKVNLKDIHKEDIDRLVEKDGIQKTFLILDKLKVVKLRNLAREYDDFVIKGRTISKASKSTLITKFRVYYEKN